MGCCCWYRCRNFAHRVFAEVKVDKGKREKEKKKSSERAHYANSVYVFYETVRFAIWIHLNSNLKLSIFKGEKKKKKLTTKRKHRK